MSARNRPPHLAATLFLIAVIHHIAAELSVGVNYGTLGNNLAPPAQVARFLKQNSIIDSIKIFDANPEVRRAFANTGIFVAPTVPNAEIPNLTDFRHARSSVDTNIRPFYPETKINYIQVGNEVLHGGQQNLIDNLFAGMKSLHQALRQSGIYALKVTTPHALSILETTEPPRLAKFGKGWDVGVLAPLLQFLRQFKSPFMVNPYPYFGYAPEKADFLLFRPNKGFFDSNTKKTYENMFDLMMDAVYVSMKNLGYGDVDIVVGETGWSSLCETSEQPRCSVANAAAYNVGLVKKFFSGRGTPLMPDRTFETYIFAILINEK